MYLDHIPPPLKYALEGKRVRFSASVTDSSVVVCGSEEFSKAGLF